MGFFSIDGGVARFLTRLGDLFVLNILTLVCSIPIFTIGAAMTALYTLTLRLARGEEGSLAAGYFKAFRDNFKQASVVWLIGGVAILFMSFDIWLLQNLEGTFGQVYRILLFVLIMLFVLELVYIFALFARFDNTIENTLKNAVVLSIGKILPAVLILIVTLLPILVLLISYRFVIVDVLIGASGPAYLASLYFTPMFKRFEETTEVCS